jgi:hypothetical protein
MTVYEFENSGGGFAKRTRESLMYNFIISAIIGLLVATTSRIINGILIGLLIYCVQYYKSKRWNKTFIDKIVFNEGNVTINYTEQNVPMNMEGSIDNFRFKKKTVLLNRTRTVYLAVYNSDSSLKIKQFEIGDWTEDKMNEVLGSYNNLNKQK